MRVKAFKALRPAQDVADKVAAVPYDVVTTAEARRLAADNPLSFLHVTHSEIDLPDGIDVHSDAVYAKAIENLDAMVDDGSLVAEDQSCMYLYRLSTDDQVQHGIVCCSHVDDYDSGVIMKHEVTRPDKEADRTRHISALNAHAGPAFLMYRDTEALAAIVANIEQGESLYDFTADDGVRHTIWRFVGGSDVIDEFETIEHCYIADGHHRCAGAARVAAERREQNPAHTGNEEYNWFLTVLFPASEIRILAYNRVITDLNGLSEERFMAEIQRKFDIRETDRRAPSEPGVFMMYLAGKWYELHWETDPEQPVEEALDISVLQNRILSPVLGINDPRTSDRIGFVGGIHGDTELARRVDVGEASVAFSVYPVRPEDLIAVSNAGSIMPPKSTWFEPKLKSGLFVHRL